MRAVIITVIAILLTVVIVIYFMGPNHQIKMQKINFTTTDNVKIVANLFEVEKPKGWLILAHMMPATKESWNDFAKEMQGLGYESLAIDLRGHGESEGGPNGFADFTDAEHQASINDLEAGWEFLGSRGAAPEKTVVIGASIGANLVLQFLTEHLDVGGGVLLSPGDYKGIDSGVLIKKLDADQKLLLVASKLDERAGGNNAESSQQYYDAASQVKNRNLIIYDGAGHGSDLFGLKDEYDLTAAIKQFLEFGFIN